MVESAQECIPCKKNTRKKGKLKIWTPTIAEAHKEMKATNIEWLDTGKPTDNKELVNRRKRCKQTFRKIYRTELAIRATNLRDKIMTQEQEIPNYSICSLTGKGIHLEVMSKIYM